MVNHDVLIERTYRSEETGESVNVTLPLLDAIYIDVLKALVAQLNKINIK